MELLNFDKNKAIEMLSAKLTCLNRQTRAERNCNNDCENCILCYQIGTFGEQKQLIKAILNTLVD